MAAGVSSAARIPFPFWQILFVMASNSALVASVRCFVVEDIFQENSEDVECRIRGSRMKTKITRLKIIATIAKLVLKLSSLVTKFVIPLGII